MVLVLFAILIANVAVLVLNMNVWIALTTFVSLVIFLIFHNWKSIRRFYYTLPRDLRLVQLIVNQY
jgi:membrane protein implicated in regulation of membrane protease activity